MVLTAEGNGTSFGECKLLGGNIMNTTFFGDCMCECVGEGGILWEPLPTIIGPIFGFHLNNDSLFILGIIFLLLITLTFLILYPILLDVYKVGMEWISNAIQWVSKWVTNKLFGKCADEKVISKSVSFFHYILKKKLRFINYLRIPESGWLILFGMVLGLLLLSTGTATHPLAKFNESYFFLILIPPITLNAAFYIHMNDIYSNVILAMVHSVLGVVIKVIIFGFIGIFATWRFHWLESFVFASLITAVDPVAVISSFHERRVNSRLSNLLENESIFTHATSIVLYSLFLSLRESTNVNFINSIGSIIGLGILKIIYSVVLSIIAGIVCGFFGSFMTKFTHKEHLQHYQILIIFLFSYISYFLSESIHASGILALFICALFMSRFLKYNLRKKSRVSSKYVLKMTSGMCESVIFLYLGIMIVLYENKFDWWFIITMNCAILIVRFFVVICINYSYIVVMYFFKMERMPRKEVFIHSFSGLRGAISFALAYAISHEVWGENKNYMVTTTLSVIVFTVFLQGTLIPALVDLFAIEKETLSCTGKQAMYHKIHKYLSKIICYLPHPKKDIDLENLTKKELLEANKRDVVLVNQVNKNYDRLKDRVKSFLHSMETAKKKYESKKENKDTGKDKDKKKKVDDDEKKKNVTKDELQPPLGQQKTEKDIEMKEVVIEINDGSPKVKKDVDDNDEKKKKKVEEEDDDDDDDEGEKKKDVCLWKIDYEILKRLEEFISTKKENLITVDEYMQGFLANEIKLAWFKRSKLINFRKEVSQRLADLCEREIHLRYPIKIKERKGKLGWIMKIVDWIDVQIQTVVNRGLKKNEIRHIEVMYEKYSVLN